MLVVQKLATLGNALSINRIELTVGFRAHYKVGHWASQGLQSAVLSAVVVTLPVYLKIITSWIKLHTQVNLPFYPYQSKRTACDLEAFLTL